ncbi:MAG: GH92 family glycosyl hydrolase [Fulvivirga sp.]
MNIIKNVAMLLAMTLATSCSTEMVTTSQIDSANLTQYVNPFIGTAPLTDPEVIGYTPPEGWRVWAGLTYPGASLPNAMVQLSPITEFGTGAGYEYEDSVIHAFTHTNKGHWNLCNIPILPLSGESSADGEYGSRFSHESETASPGFYGVTLQDYDIIVRLTTSLRCGFHQYQYADQEGRKILFDLSKANNRIRDWKIERVSKNSVQGFQQPGHEKIYFYAQLSEEIEKLDIIGEGTREGHAILTIKDGNNNPVELKIGLSYVSELNARQNLEEEILNKSFEEVKDAATDTWETLLAKIAIAGGTEKQKGMFYSSLYRSFLWPALRSDVNGEFRDVKGDVVNEGFSYYTNPSLWDTYRNKLVLMTLLSPKVTTDVIKSLIDKGENTGFIPTFFHGDHAAPFITGAYLRGVDDFDVNAAYQLLLNNANKEGGTRPHILEYIDKGYISTPEVESPHVETKAKAGVSKTLEYAYDDYSLSLLARALNDTVNYNVLTARSKNYKNVFDQATNFMRGRLENGEWVKDFNPQYPYYEYMYREANAWQVSFFAPHDMQGLIALYGGEKNFEDKLDSLYSVPWNPSHIARNVSSFIGQYCHGNQPDHEAPFAYHFIDKPGKSQVIIDNILNNLYGIGESGLALPGMDDAGEMSSWYVFSALGLYPFSPADDEYIVTVPLFDEVRWKLDNGKELVIKKPESGRDLHAITVNDEDHKGYFVSHDLFKEGGIINVVTE